MYNISFTPDRPLTYHLEDDQSLARLSLVPGRGGLVTEWTIQGQPVLYFDQERFQDPSLSVRGGSRFYFPFAAICPMISLTMQV
ncbi:aldose epimerase family protein [Synechocystis salina]|uniref:hypothetical protein n=1 Tax=Synechocystis salina TaxID=945780 RepID=UPI001D15AEF5|nr:hypothetical protein [Synechocystis salina]